MFFHLPQIILKDIALMKTKTIYKLLALLCSALTFFAVGYIFYSNYSPISFIAVVPLAGTVFFSRLSK